LIQKALYIIWLSDLLTMKVITETRGVHEARYLRSY